MPREYTPIIKHEMNSWDVLNVTTMVQGPTGTGKSQTSLFICSLLKDDIDIVSVYCPTNIYHKDWTGVVPDITIMKELTGQKITDLIEKQEKRKALRKYAKTLPYWKEIPGSEKIDAKFAQEKKERLEILEKNKKTYSSNDFIRHKYEIERLRRLRDKASRELITKYYKNIYKRYGVTPNDNGEDAAKITAFIHGFRLCFNALIIVDDCSDQIKNVTEQTWQKLLNMNRHFKITVLITAHNLCNIKYSVMRTSPTWQIFTDTGSATYFLTNSSTGMKNVIIPDSNQLKSSFSFDKDRGNMTKVLVNTRDNYIAKFKFDLGNKPVLGAKILWDFSNKVIEETKKREPKFDF